MNGHQPTSPGTPDRLVAAEARARTPTGAQGRRVSWVRIYLLIAASAFNAGMLAWVIWFRAP